MTQRPPETADRWPASFALLAFVLAFVTASVLAVVVTAVATVMAGESRTDAPGVVLISTVLQDAAFVGAAIWLARQTGSVRPTDFGLRAASLRRAAAWTLGVGVAFYGLLSAYGALIEEEGDQDVLEAFGVDRGIGLLIAGGVMVVVLAPFAEEILFRGFMYRALRNRLSPLSAAAVIGAVFGSIHYSGADTVPLIPPLMVLGFAFCVLYERTGSLYPAIALHAFNNALAFAGTADEDGALPVAMTALLVTLALCVWLPRRSP